MTPTVGMAILVLTWIVCEHRRADGIALAALLLLGSCAAVEHGAYAVAATICICVCVVGVVTAFLAPLRAAQHDTQDPTA